MGLVLTSSGGFRPELNFPRRGVVHFDSWAGRTTTPVMVLGETPKRYRVRWIKSAWGRVEGSESLVPKYAVTFERSLSW